MTTTLSAKTKNAILEEIVEINDHYKDNNYNFLTQSDKLPVLKDTKVSFNSLVLAKLINNEDLFFMTKLMDVEKVNDFAFKSIRLQSQFNTHTPILSFEPKPWQKSYDFYNILLNSDISHAKYLADKISPDLKKAFYNYDMDDICIVIAKNINNEYFICYQAISDELNNTIIAELESEYLFNNENPMLYKSISLDSLYLTDKYNFKIKLNYFPLIADTFKLEMIEAFKLSELILNDPVEK